MAKIAVIGTGISGLGAAYMLYPYHDITVYEKNDYIGGHSRTLEIMDNGRNIPVDTGFIVYNKPNYPHLTNMFEHLGVKTEKSDMSFGVSIANGWLEYSSKGIFAQKRNLFRPKYWKMLRDIVRFNRNAAQYMSRGNKYTLRNCLDDLEMGDWFKTYYLQAMGAAIWSCSVETILDFPAKTFLQFFKNHGLLTVTKHPQWRTVSGGSQEYIKKITEPFKDDIRLNCAVGMVEKSLNADTWDVTDVQGNTHIYDKIVFACHADDTLKILKNAAPEPVRKVLSAFTYQDNKVVLHKDKTFMPRREKTWASWIYLSETANDTKDTVSLTYWMNNLQNMETADPLLVTLNPGRMPDEGKIYNTHHFKHPVFNADAIKAQEGIKNIQGIENLWFCGAYQRYGFHEDGLMSAVDVIQKMGINCPWP